jgi:thiamine-phosphate pyrophosphorylase
MQLIVITSSERIEREAEKINALFEVGMEILHIRKPDFSKKEYINLLEEIKQKYHKQIKIHEFFELTENYNLLGVHLNVRTPNYTGKRKINISKSVHSIEELEKISEYDYVFLSPIFDSISKKGYFSNFDDETLCTASLNGKINRKVIALGGINQQTLPLLKKYAFGGAAVLGCIWTPHPSPPQKGGSSPPLEGLGEVNNFLNLKLC